MKPNLVLSIDTAGAFASVALGDTGSELASADSGGAEGGSGHSYSENLIALIERVISGAGARFDQVGKIVLGCGPGSFTGLRIGFATVQGLAVTRGDLAVYSLPSSLGVASLGVANIGAGASRVLASAGKGIVFDSAVDHERGVAACCMRSIEDLERFGAVTGPTIAALAPIPELGGVQVAKGLASGLLKVFFAFPEKFAPVSDLATLEPDYVRPVAAKSIAERTPPVG